MSSDLFFNSNITKGFKKRYHQIYESIFLCPFCKENTNHNLFLVKKNTNISSMHSLLNFNIEKDYVLKCQNCNLERRLDVNKKIFKEQNDKKKYLDFLLFKDKWSFYNKNIKKCKYCGHIVGDIFEIKKYSENLRCEKCGKDISYLIRSAVKNQREHKRAVIAILIFLGIVILIQLLLENF